MRARQVVLLVIALLLVFALVVTMAPPAPSP